MRTHTERVKRIWKKNLQFLKFIVVRYIFKKKKDVDLMNELNRFHSTRSDKKNSFPELDYNKQLKSLTSHS